MTTREIALGILIEVERGEGFIDNIFDRVASRHELEGRDRRFVQEMTYGVTRLKGRLDHIIDSSCRRRVADSRVRNVLRMGAYQIRFMDVPDYAAVDESVRLLGVQGSKVMAFANAVLRGIAERGVEALPDRETEPVRFLATFYSHPEWLVARWMERFGYEQTKNLCEVDNEIPPLSLRVNRRRGSVEDVSRLLRQEGLDCTSGRHLPYVLRVRGSIHLQELEPFMDGLIQVQDESAALVAELANPQPGEMVVDLCASPGGKTTHIAELMGESGLVVAVDVSVKRLRPLLDNVARLRVGSVVPVVSDSRSFAIKPVDLVLVDVPCSGTGTLRRRPDLRWRRGESDLLSLAKLQLSLLINAGEIVREGGRIVYSTCSIEPEENEGVVEEFLESHQEFVLEKIPGHFPEELVREGMYLATLPHLHQIDGMFAAVLVKKNVDCGCARSLQDHTRSARRKAR